MARIKVEFPANNSAEEITRWHAAWRELGGGPVEIVALAAVSPAGHECRTRQRRLVGLSVVVALSVLGVALAVWQVAR